MRDRAIRSETMAGSDAFPIGKANASVRVTLVLAPGRMCGT